MRRRLASLDDARGVERELLENVALLRPVDVVVNPGRELPDFVEAKLLDFSQRAAQGEPVQYLTGRASFYGMDLNVSPSVLIPRLETAELVDLIAARFGRRKDLRVIDLGTGSGAIAIALARTLPFAQVTALDLSAPALDVARRNAREQRVKIDFIQGDMLTFRPGQFYDIVVSNPPYVLESERVDMDDRVLSHEPGMALFVPDSDPLRFYSAVIRNFSGKAGAIYFEINPLEADKFKDAELVRDSFGKIRFAIYDPACNAPTGL